MRSLQQPGPVHPRRIDSVPGHPQLLHFALTPGATLNEALTAPLIAAGFQAATMTFGTAALQPFRYVMPGPPDDASHVAYFSAAQEPAGGSRIEQANVTFGWAGDKPFVHCHAVWREADGRRRGGHILPHESRMLEAAEATAWGFSTIKMEVFPDTETNFSLFQPSGRSIQGGRGIVARVKPNEDILTAIETVAETHGVTEADVRGSLGSLIGAHFADGSRVIDDATEVLVREGCLRGGRASLDMLVVDGTGQVHEGWLEHGQNPVCITFDLVLEIAAIS